MKPVAKAFSLSLHALVFSLLVVAGAGAGNFNEEFDITFGDGRAKIQNDGSLLTLSLDKSSGSGFRSKHQYLFGKLEMDIKLVAGNSAGTVTTYYLRSEGKTWDEIDFEFLGNVSGEPYTIHTNVFTQGKGNREQQFQLWFDPTADFHKYTVLWNPSRIVFFIDGTPIREFKNMSTAGVLFPINQPMKLESTLWNADDWATQGGKVKADWSHAPFTASYRNFNAANSCVWTGGSSNCSGGSMASPDGTWLAEKLDSAALEKLAWAQKNHMIYNYCTDTKRFSSGFPPECKAA